jgi:hypothetical protein
MSRNSFVVSDDHFSDDENMKENKEVKPTISSVFWGKMGF